jgi:hypothetical protein
VTGASSGIGEAMVRRLGAAGVPQVVVARRVDRLQQLAADYADVEVLEADLASKAGVDKVAARITDLQRPIELVVNNAGFGTSGVFAELDDGRLSDEIGVNVVALTRLSRAALGVMMLRGRGYVLNVSSVASFQPAPKFAVYAATKAFVTSLSESLHEECRGSGVHVTALCPGLTRTEFQDVSNITEARGDYPEVMWMTADEVAEAGLRDVAAGKALSIPGVMYKGLVSAVGVTPRRLLRRLSGVVQRSAQK